MRTFTPGTVAIWTSTCRIRGNNYRLIATIDFIDQVILVHSVLTHAEYDRGRWKR